MKKKIILFVVLISLFSIVAEAAFSGKYLCVRRSGKTYKHRLYTAKSDFVIACPVVAIKAGGTTHYGRLRIKDSYDHSYACIKHASGTCELWERAHSYLGAWNLSYSPRGIATDGTYFYVTAASAIWKIDSSGSVVHTWTAGLTPAGIVYHPGTGLLFVVDNVNDRVNSYTTGGSAAGSPIGTSGTGNGQFQDPWGIAVDGSYVVVQDIDGRTQWFNAASRAFYKVVNTGGTTAVTVDPVSGDIYVSNTSTAIIRQYSSSGSYVTQWSSGGLAYGLAVDVNGNIFSTDATAEKIRAFRPGGSPLYPVYDSSSQGTDPYGLTFDQAGNLYVVCYTSKTITRFN